MAHLGRISAPVRDSTLPTIPSVAAYLAKLPSGVSSHPDCTIKASILRSWLETRPLGASVPLPAPVRAIVERPPAVSAWISEVHFNVVGLAIREVHFDDDEERYLAWAYGSARAILSTALYRVLFAVMSPDRLLIGMQQRWGAFRRGTELSCVERSRGKVHLHLRAPPNHYAMTNVLAMGVALRAAIDAAGAKGLSIHSELVSPTIAAYRIRWDD